MKALMSPETMSRPSGPLALICGESDSYLFMETHLLAQRCYHAMAVDEERLVEEARLLRPVMIVLACRSVSAAVALIAGLRVDPRSRSIGVIVTAGAGLFPVREMHDAGAHELLARPFTGDDFIDAVDRVPLAAARHRVSVDCTLDALDQRAPYCGATALDISATGVLVQSARRLPVGDRYRLSGSVSLGDFVLDATVVRRAWEKGPQHYALTFVQPPRLVRSAIRTFGLWPVEDGGATLRA